MEILNMDSGNKGRFLLIVLTFLLTLALAGPSEAQVRPGFLYALSNFTGRVPYDLVRVSIDKERTEVYVISYNYLRVFNEYGMEIYRFGDDLDLGSILDVAVDQKGDVLLLCYRGTEPSIVRCNYRGEPVTRIELKNLPPEFSGFGPDRIAYQDGILYLVSMTGMRVLTVDAEGRFRKGIDLLPLLELDEASRGNVMMSGFSVDRGGNILFTVAVLFKAYMLSPDGKLTWFGKPGSSPGKFNIAGGIARDSKGNFLVVDKLKSTVMVFNNNFDYLSQFGFRGQRPENLISPDDMVIDKNDRIYVTQGRRRGINVYALGYN
jgi:hypothetical protein